jgi:hypothetical protein
MMSADFQTLLPEIVLAGYAMAALMVGGLHDQGQAGPGACLGDGGAVRGAGALHRHWRAGERLVFGGMFIDDPFARFAKVTILVGCGRAGDEPGLHDAARPSAVRIPDPGHAGRGGHDGDGLGRPT